ncbi:hypothetical protein [Nocardioides marmoribigeumensis]|jgi:hypothetical protein|uniref:DUF2382 domain-containing protein n=1 Tax=Nocardioides marmoribigeumensis TaxID=433649 RepID=A0ABU2BPD9_9ACTN|nr:hypothetical protein [Nocardioides marmoribigeumensis]MDR7360497.1 hypothetical protein [Nocardioides marmoribigeumensis]
MLLSKAIDLTDTVTASVTAHLPGPLAGPVHLAVSTLTWVPRQVVEHLHGDRDQAAADERPTAQPTHDQAAPDLAEEPQAHEPEVVLTLDRPAREVEPPVDVVGEALRADASAAEPLAPLEDEGHVEVEERVVYSTSSDEA